MRRVKSAPADLALMKNNKQIKKPTVYMLSKTSQSNIIEYKTKPRFDINYNFIDKNREKISYTTSLFADFINETNHNSLEECSLIYTLFAYISNNILKKNKIKEVYNILLQQLIRYLVVMFIHTQIIHDKVLTLPNIIHTISH